MASRKEQKEAAKQERLAQEAQLAAKAKKARLTKLFAFLGVALAVVAAVIILGVGQGTGVSAGNVNDVAAVNELLSGIPQAGMTLGNAASPVKVAEYGDLQCPVCDEFTLQALPTIIKGPIAAGKLAWTFHNWTIISAQSTTAAEASLAAAKQGRAWQFIELFYHNQGEERSGYVTSAYLDGLAQAARLNVAEFNKDRQNPAYASEAKADYAYAVKKGFTGTPSFVITGPKGTRSISGQLPTPSQLNADLNAVS